MRKALLIKIIKIQAENIEVHTIYLHYSIAVTLLYGNLNDNINSASE